MSRPSRTRPSAADAPIGRPTLRTVADLAGVHIEATMLGAAARVVELARGEGSA